MGTRHLIAVQLDGQYRIAQYGQWDGYPSGQGADVLRFLQGWDRERFEAKLRRTAWFTPEELEGLGDDWKRTHGYLSRDMGADILAYVMNASAGVKLKNSIDFAGDSLFCEWAYVIDLDKNTLEVFKGFNKESVEGQRFANAPLDHPEYKPVRLLKTYSLDHLPDVKQLEFDCDPAEEDESA